MTSSAKNICRRLGSALVVGFCTGGAIGAVLMFFSVFFVVSFEWHVFLFGVFEWYFFFYIAVALGSATGGIFALITYPFVRNMDIPKVVACLAGGTLLFGLSSYIIMLILMGPGPPILSWPAGMLGYWATFPFRHELVALINWWEARQEKGEGEH